MKILKARNDLVLTFFLSFSTLSLCAYFFFKQRLTTLSLVNIVSTLILLLFCCFPRAKQTLGNASDKKPRTVWLRQLFLSQCLMMLFFWSFSRLLNPSFLIAPTLNGFFSWGFTIFTALSLGYATYSLKKPGLLSSTYSPFFANTSLDSVGFTVDCYMRLLTLFCLEVLLLTLILGCLALFQEWLTLPMVFGFHVEVALVGCALFCITTQPSLIKLLHRLSEKGVSTATLFIGIAISLAMIYPVLSHYSPLLLPPSLSQRISFQPFQYATLADFNLVTTTTFLAFGAINGAFIAWLSRGYSFRDIILVSFLGNAVCWGMIYLIEHTFTIERTITLLVLISCVITLIVLLLQPKVFTYFHRATMPSDAPIKPRSPFRLIKLTPLITASFLCGYAALGFGFWSCMAIFVLLPCLLMLWIGHIAFFFAPADAASSLSLRVDELPREEIPSL